MIIIITLFFSGLRRFQETVKQVRADIAAKLPILEERAPKTDRSAQNEDSASHVQNAQGGDTLEDLVRTLNLQIQDSDWLKENTAEKWVADNPELAKAFLKQDAQK